MDLYISEVKFKDRHGFKTKVSHILVTFKKPCLSLVQDYKVTVYKYDPSVIV
jgi:hypothetical protein